MIREFRFGNAAAGDGHPVLIVAETGINHNGSMELAERMIEEAAMSEVGAVKFQTFSAEEFMSSADQTYTYMSNGKSVTESMLGMFKRCELSVGSFKTLFELARTLGLEAFSTPTDIECAKKLIQFGLPAIKVGSDDLINLPLLKELAGLGKPMILSTGMADSDEISRGMETVLGAGAHSVAVMVCTSLYPTPPGSGNLRRITTLRSRFPETVIGFSDHTQGTNSACLAVALGASIIEKHFTLDRTMPGPDHWFSADPTELRRLVRDIRRSEQSLGSGKVEPAAEELKMRDIARRSLAAADDLPAGKPLSRSDLCCKRPGTGIQPRFLDSLVGARTARPVSANSLLNAADLVPEQGGANLPGTLAASATGSWPLVFGSETGPSVSSFSSAACPRVLGFDRQANQPGSSMSPHEASTAAFESNIAGNPAPTDRIPHNSPHFTREDVEVLEKVLACGWVATGPKTLAFEKALARAIDPADTSEAVMVSSGTAALYLAVRFTGIGPGDEVIVPNFSCTAISNAVRMAGAVPVPVDSDPGDFNMCPQAAASAVSKRTRGFIAPGTFGVPARIDKIAAAVSSAAGRPVSLFGSPFPPSADLIVAIEDCAQCIGSFHGVPAPNIEIERPAGSLGWCSIASFHATKIITGGTGGALISAPSSAATWARNFINYDMPENSRERFNFLPGDLASALACSQFSRLNLLISARRFAAESYETVLRRYPWTKIQVCPDGAVTNHFRFVILMPDKNSRDRAITLFSKCGIAVIGPILSGELIANHLGIQGNFRISNSLADTLLSLPVFPSLGPKRISRVAETLDRVLAEIEE